MQPGRRATDNYRDTLLPHYGRESARMGIRFVQTFVPGRASGESLEDDPVTMTREAAQQICLPPVLENAAAVRRAVTRALAALGASGDEAADMVLAVNEAF